VFMVQYDDDDDDDDVDVIIMFFVRKVEKQICVEMCTHKPLLGHTIRQG
jgi:hypothetical protein